MKSIFLNSDYIVIEYMDLIKNPYLVLLNAFRLNKNSHIREILNLDSIDYLDKDGLYEWYINRKHFNFFKDLNRYPNEIPDEFLDGLLEECMNNFPEAYSSCSPLSLVSMLYTLKNLKEKITGGIIIYHPYKNDYAKNDLNHLLGVDYTFMSDFNEVMETAKENSTYFLADINKIYQMRDFGCLKYSSVTLPVEYRYNKKNMTEFNLDFDELVITHPFKLSYTTALVYETEKSNDSFISDIS